MKKDEAEVCQRVSYLRIVVFRAAELQAAIRGPRPL